MNFDQALQKYGPTAWNAALAQVRLDTIGAVIWASVFVLLLIATWVIALKIVKHYQGKYDEGERIFTLVCAGFLSLVFLVIIALNISTIIGNLVNPTWAAIQHFIPGDGD